ncbi:hypothetical protein KEF85_03420 [Methylomonas paludis]|uniref:Uncharacterized protein n=1 Tax=Methylomonas paludis TaxID=1173101 RepID=A0A975MPA9_9GAMM|nr:hypothetical protein [Methylomonas paludis]QWF71543.1 hypothetical protein KEF85_03420 [Methylomonas paludis]
MSIINSLTKRSTLDAAIKQIGKARKSEAGLAEQLYKGAYQGFAKVISDNLTISQALYYWGFGLLHQAEQQDPEQAIATLEDAVSKFSFCLLIAPHYLGAAIDGGVAYMTLARLSTTEAKPRLYSKAEQFFETAGEIQKGSAAYNLACIYALKGDETACLNALTLARQTGSLPDEPVILQDSDLASIIETDWFKQFIADLHTQPAVAASTKTEAVDIDYEPKMKLKKSEDFDYYSK